MLGNLGWLFGNILPIIFHVRFPNPFSNSRGDPGNSGVLHVFPGAGASGEQDGGGVSLQDNPCGCSGRGFHTPAAGLWLGAADLKGYAHCRRPLGNR